uniref:Integrase catalytic domain-containing protein n=1 Tax=Amphimedon queenslandica TaxID=400682 RepID=A0A1X7TF04_AMPQE
MKLLGSHRLRTTAYHSMSNGIIEHFHRTLKAALRAHGQDTPWFQALPLVLLGIRTAVKEDLEFSSAELVYGSPLRLPCQFFLPSLDTVPDTTYLSKLKSIMSQISFVPTRAQSSHTLFIHPDLQSAKFVFIRHDAS